MGERSPDRKASIIGWVALLGLVSAAAIGCPSSPGAPAPSVILITVDTLRADRLGCYGSSSVETPAMDSLARDGVLFRRAIAQVPLTTPSHAVILTGTYPMWNGLRNWDDHGLRPGVPTLAEIFKRHRYATAAFVSTFVLDSMWGLNRGFDHYDDWFKTEDYQTMQRAGLKRRGAETIARSVAWLKSRPAGPFFLWVHLYDPHSPYDPPEPYGTRYRGHPYDGEVAYTDAELGRFLTFLKSQDLYDSSLILLTSDHGEALGEHQEKEHGFFIYNSTVHVPLVIKFPAGYVPEHRSVSSIVNTVDIAPTLARYCSFPSADMRTFQGQSLLSLVERGPTGNPRYGYSESLYPGIFFGSQALFGVETEQYHYIRAPREELYDVQKDPGERRNILDENRAVAHALRQELEGTLSRFKPPAGESGQRGLDDPETVEKLRSLGYVSLSKPRRPGAEFDPSAPDPKDTIGAFNQVMRAIQLPYQNRLREANALLDRLANEYPQDYLLPFLQGENRMKAGEARAAREYFRRALELNPTFDQAAMSLGRAAYDAEENSEAVNAYQLALKLNPHNFLARLGLAKVYWRLKRFSEAANEQREVLRTHPQFAEAHADYGITLVQQKKFEEALPPLLKGLEMGYREATVYNFLGNAYIALGRRAEGLKAYEQSVSLDPTYPTPLINLAILYDEMGEHAKSQEYFQKACRMNPELCRQLKGRVR